MSASKSAEEVVRSRHFFAKYLIRRDFSQRLRSAIRILLSEEQAERLAPQDEGRYRAMTGSLFEAPILRSERATPRRSMQERSPYPLLLAA